MSDAATLSRDPSTPRARNAEATRAAILEAAKALFARVGYDSTSLRDIATEARADAALVKRYFGGKEALFKAALEASFRPDSLKGRDRATFAREVATMMAGTPHTNEARNHTFQLVLRAATSPATAPMLNTAMQERFLAPIREWLDGEQAAARARVLAATYIGFLVERLIRDEPLSGAERDAFIDRAAFVLEAMLRPEP